MDLEFTIVFRRAGASFQTSSSQIPKCANQGKRVAGQPRSGRGPKIEGKWSDHHRRLHAGSQVSQKTSGRVCEEQGQGKKAEVGPQIRRTLFQRKGLYFQ